MAFISAAPLKDPFSYYSPTPPSASRPIAYSGLEPPYSELCHDSCVCPRLTPSLHVPVPVAVDAVTGPARLGVSGKWTRPVAHHLRLPQWGHYPVPGIRGRLEDRGSLDSQLPRQQSLLSISLLGALENVLRWYGSG